MSCYRQHHLRQWLPIHPPRTDDPGPRNLHRSSSVPNSKKKPSLPWLWSYSLKRSLCVDHPCQSPTVWREFSTVATLNPLRGRRGLQLVRTQSRGGEVRLYQRNKRRAGRSDTRWFHLRHPGKTNPGSPGRVLDRVVSVFTCQVLNQGTGPTQTHGQTGTWALKKRTVETCNHFHGLKMQSEIFHQKWRIGPSVVSGNWSLQKDTASALSDCRSDPPRVKWR